MGFFGQRPRVRRQRQRAFFTRNGTTITRESGDVAYAIACSRCDFFSFAVTARGFMCYRDAVRLAERHVCDVLDFE